MIFLAVAEAVAVGRKTSAFLAVAEAVAVGQKTTAFLAVGQKPTSILAVD